MTMKSLQRGSIAPDDHHLRPLITYSSPSRSILVAMLVASDEATSGSVMQNADLISPSSSGSSHRWTCSALPNSASTSMFPVSGAAQFSASGAIAPLRPLPDLAGRFGLGDLIGEGRLSRVDVGVHEGEQFAAKFLGSCVISEVHLAPPDESGQACLPTS